MEDENIKKGKTEKDFIRDFLKRWNVLALEEQTIKEAKKDLKDEFKDKLDVKAINQAVRISKIKMKADNPAKIDEILDQIEKEGLTV